MKIAIAQLDAVWEDKAATKEHIRALLGRLPPRERIDWLLFPEMTLTGFTMNAQKAALDTQDLAFFGDLAGCWNAFITFGGVQDGRNNCITMDRTGRVISTYSKTHLFSLGGEDRNYLPGSRRERFVIDNLAVTPAVCFDLRFPYLFWDAAAPPHLLAVIACWPAQRAEHWTRLLQARAIENQCYAVGVNRTGRDPQTEYTGGSLVIGPLGETVLDCKSAAGIYLADISEQAVLRARERLPFIKSRRSDIASL